MRIKLLLALAFFPALLAAQEHPEQYSDLLVRVGGFSAYFCKLPKLMQQEIIDRDAHAFE